MRNLPTATLVSAALLVSTAAHAMEIRQFHTMADQDQARYIGDLIVGAENVLTVAGRINDAQEVKRLFTTKNPGDSDTIGMASFEANLVSLRVTDARNAEKNPGAKRLQVEHALILALKDNGITLPTSFMTVAKDFKPKFPPAKP